MYQRLLSVSVFLLFGLSVYSGILIIANFSASFSASELKKWQKNLTVPDEEGLQVISSRLQPALSLDSSNPQYLEKEARLFQYRAFALPTGLQRAAASREALTRYRQLLTLRPSWAPYWANIVAIKYDLWEFDDAMRTAMHNAARLGPWFKTNQHIILQAGFHGWAFIDVETRGVVDKTLERAMLLQPKETIRLAFNQGFGDRVAPFIEADEELKGVYEKELERMKRKLKK